MLEVERRWRYDLVFED